ncbi:MAG: fibronectin type III domain-containing protein [Deltaproteobacteria bacterium]|nr:fibronectin type III domain-containing protein [Deltaproteobacteria bacterium]
MRALGAVLVLLPAVALADGNGVCHTVTIGLLPQASTALPLDEPPQIVAWVEKPDGTYVDTIYITAQTGRFGMGNRPGRYDYMSAPMWPYGRRITTFPVWAHRHGKTFDVVEFQSSPADPRDCFTMGGGSGPDYAACGENDLSHQFEQSSPERHYCQPLCKGCTPRDTQKWNTAVDTMTCATAAFSDKGKFTQAIPAGEPETLYPPRTDVSRTNNDSPDVPTYKQHNPFDAVSQATPHEGEEAGLSWAVPQALPAGDYVMWIEVSKAFDMNGTYNETTYPPAPNIIYAEYGIPYLGQPSLVYKLPFTIDLADHTVGTVQYAGYGDPLGKTGTLHAPDATITTNTPGSGDSRLQIMTDGNRVRVNSHVELDSTPPSDPAGMTTAVTSSSVQLAFTAPGDDGATGTVQRYDVRYLVGEPVTDASWDRAVPVLTTDPIVAGGQTQQLTIAGLLPSTTYDIGIRAADNCFNTSAIVSLQATTAAQQSAAVDACFVATAAYGSVMANDVAMLRHFRDSVLQRTAIGELAVEAYYTFGPAAANVIGQSELLRETARDALRPVVTVVRRMAF